VTRLAPSPTGALHLGNARTFLVTWALARQRGLRVVMRIEDLDSPRVKPGAVESILGTFRWLGMDWDNPEPLVQSRDLEPYRAAIRILAARGLVYPCSLTRTEIEAAASAPQEGSHETSYPRHLRPALKSLDFDGVDRGTGPEGTNWRFAVPDRPVPFDDDFAGPQSPDISRIVGDFVVWTRRGQPAYQLAVVVDDHRQGVTSVIRGDDLLDSAARQLLLYRALGLAPEPRHMHLPLVLGRDGKRLAKRHGDTRVEHYRSLGVPPGAVVGLVAGWCGCTEEGSGRREMSTAEFVRALDSSSIPRTPVVFGPEDDQWLLAQAGS
jgi:glutamyl-tRNA synthetase